MLDIVQLRHCNIAESDEVNTLVIPASEMGWIGQLFDEPPNQLSVYLGGQHVFVLDDYDGHAWTYVQMSTSVVIDVVNDLQFWSAGRWHDFVPASMNTPR